MPPPNGTPYTTIQANLSITLAEAKLWLRIDDTDEDQLIQDIIDQVKSQADAYCQNDFTDSFGNFYGIPNDIKIWCKRQISLNYERRSNRIQKDNVHGLGAIEYLDADKEEYGELEHWRSSPGF